jgi:REP element-mobilizing transposase RayT
MNQWCWIFRASRRASTSTPGNDRFFGTWGKQASRASRNIGATYCRNWRFVTSGRSSPSEPIDCGGEDDHVHLLVVYPPKVSISTPVNSLKGVSSCLLRECRPEITGRYRDGVLWSPSYFAGSCGGAPLSIIKRYVEHQRGAAPPPHPKGPQKDGFPGYPMTASGVLPPVRFRFPFPPRCRSIDRLGCDAASA